MNHALYLLAGKAGPHVDGSLGNYQIQHDGARSELSHPCSCSNTESPHLRDIIVECLITAGCRDSVMATLSFLKDCFEIARHFLPSPPF